MTEREFWIQMRRGLITVIAAISDGAPRQPFWDQVANGFGMVVLAIDNRYDLPHSTRVPTGEGAIVGTFTTQEPPAKPLAPIHHRNGAT